MAGLGYKTFNIGDTLTAAQVQGYLQDQTVMRFASATARNTAIGAAVAEGMLCYLDDTNAIQYYDGAAWQTLSTGGDITGVTAGTGLTGGGTSGDVTLSFDIANYGGGQYAAGKNKIINGDFGVWQRGTSFAGNVYTADRWTSDIGGSNATFTYSQQTFTPGTAPVSGYEGTYFLRMAQSTNGTGQAYFNIFTQKIEDVRIFAGQTVTISAWIKSDSARSVFFQLSQQFGSGGSAGVTVNGAAITTSTGWTRYTQTLSVPSIAGKTIGTGSWLQLNLATSTINTAQTHDIWGVQIEAGSTASPFQTATGTKQGELAACQRYYFRWTPNAIYQDAGVGYNPSTTTASIITQFPVQMRIAPTALEQTGTGTNYNVLHTAGGAPARQQCNGVPTFQSANTNNARTYFPVASGLTAGQGSMAGNDNNTVGYLGWSAEL